MQVPAPVQVTVPDFAVVPSVSAKFAPVKPETSAPAESLTVTGIFFVAGQLLLSSAPSVTARSFTGCGFGLLIVTLIVPVFWSCGLNAATAM